jgi:hypothetical protein
MFGQTLKQYSTVFNYSFLSAKISVIVLFSFINYRILLLEYGIAIAYLKLVIRAERQ